MKSPEFMAEAMEHEINSRSIPEQTAFNRNRNQRAAVQRELDTILANLTRLPGFNANTVYETKEVSVPSGNY